MKLSVVLLISLGACGSDGGSPPTEETPGAPAPGQPPVLRVETVVSGLNSPVHMASPPRDARIFVVEQQGRIRLVRDGQLAAGSFLDIADRVRSGGERGLLSVAFHPDFASNGFLYVNYTDLNGDTRIERYTAAGGGDVADPAAGKLILTVAQPYSNHNGGLILFGPDGKLYIGMGDGGSGGDPHNHGQNRATLLGSLLRIDVDAGDPYAIPADNPYAGSPGMRPEIWAYGLRNPWRFTFDREAGMLYIADVGQNRREEINAVPATQAGVNYGWKIMEASSCFGSSSCDRSGLRLPVHEYDHGDGCSITGGHVYRGDRISALRGHYLYADYCEGWVKSFRLHNGSAADQRTHDFGDLGSITSFGEDASGESYILSTNGRLYRIVP